MRILMPSIVDPVSQLGGAWTATRGLVDLLRASPFDAEVVLVPPDVLSPTAHRARQYLALAQSFVSGVPAKFQFKFSRRVLATMKDLLSKADFDLILINGSDLLWMLPHLPPAAARILVAHNVEHLLYADQIAVEGPHWLPLKSILRSDCARLRKQELAGLRAIGNVVFLSSEDERYVRVACPHLRAISVPPLMKASPAARPPYSVGSSVMEIGMLANFGWWPSQQGVRWFLREVFPYLNHARLHLFGNHSQEVASEHSNVVKHGYLLELGVIWSACDFMICPVFAGGGVSIKLVEAISHGVPVVATHYAIRGIPVEPDPAIVLRDSTREWIEFLNSPAARELHRLSPSPRIIARFLPECYIEGLSNFLKAVLSEARSSKVEPIVEVRQSEKIAFDTQGSDS